MAWGSDAVAELLRSLGLSYVALVPGASYRGLHDSLVNYLDDQRPTIALCLHEEHAVAIAHGYAKVTGQPMAVALHSNVGLMHATMALFNAYCDRAPMVVLGATGPVDAARRRPWIDWIHTSADQGALVRNYCKWDDTPVSLGAALESLARAYVLTSAYPQAPTYVCLDATLQEEALAGPADVSRLTGCQVPTPPAPSFDDVDRVRAAIERSSRPLFLVGRGSRSETAWRSRIALAEAVGAAVLVDLKTAAGFPTGHRLHQAVPGTHVTVSGRDLIRRADLLVGLDWIDLEGTITEAFPDGRDRPFVVSCTADFTLHNGWSKDHCSFERPDLAVGASPDALVDGLLRRFEDGGSFGERDDGWPGEPARRVPGAGSGGRRTNAGESISVADLAWSLREAVAGTPVTTTGICFGFPGEALEVDGPISYLGRDGGGGLGSGPGLAVGAALALAESGRLPVAVLGDGDFLMGSSALWTAAHLDLSLLVVVANNRSFHNDVLHQERVARARRRPVENRGVGQHLRDPEPDIAGVARALGLAGYGPVRSPAELGVVLAEAVEHVRAGRGPAVVDVWTEPDDEARARQEVVGSYTASSRRPAGR